MRMSCNGSILAPKFIKVEVSNLERVVHHQEKKTLFGLDLHYYMIMYEIIVDYIDDVSL